MNRDREKEEWEDSMGGNQGAREEEEVWIWALT
jgi:hypothetical protein